MYHVQQDDLDLLFQKNRELRFRLELLDMRYRIIGTLDGALIDGSAAINAESAIRRTAAFTLQVLDSSFQVDAMAKIWMDKYVRVHVGVKSQRTGEIRLYNMGIYLFNDATFTYNAVTNELSLSCLDLMSKLTGEYGGQVTAYETVIEAAKGHRIRDVMIAALTQLGGMDRYLIEDIGAEYGDGVSPYADVPYTEIPYDLEFGTGATVYEIIEKLATLYPAYETFFDVDGTFVCRRIPTLASAPVVLDDEILQRLVVSESVSIPFSSVRNVTEVWGVCHDARHFSQTSILSGKQYMISIAEFATLSHNELVAFAVQQGNPANPTLKINTLAALPIVGGNNQGLVAGVMTSGYTYVVRYDAVYAKYYFLGRHQIYGKAVDDNPDSPFYVGRIGEIKQVLSGGEYEQIYTDELADERARYENWKSTRLQDTVTLEMIAVPWLDVNQKVRYAPQGAAEPREYIVKAIDHTFSEGTMTMTMIRFYPLYPF